jgi:hypothetical protein
MCRQQRPNVVLEIANVIGLLRVIAASGLTEPQHCEGNCHG